MKENRIVYTFRFYDKVQKKWKKANATTWRSAEMYRQVLALEERYCYISEIYERDITKINSY